MHVGLLDPWYLFPFGNIKINEKGLDEIKAEEVDVKTWSRGKPSSSPGDSQYAQSFIGDDQMQSAADPCDPSYAQISAADTQTEKWSQSNIDPCDPPWIRIEYYWLLQAPSYECQASWSKLINPSKTHDQEREVLNEVMSRCEKAQWMIAEKMVPLCMSAQTSSTLKMWPQIEHPRTRVEGWQTQALSTQNLSEGLTHPPSRESRPPPLLWDVSVIVLELVLVVVQLF